MDAPLPAIGRPGARLWLLLPPLAFLGLFLFYPFIRILALGFAPLAGAGWGGVRDLFLRTDVGPLLASSAGQALASTGLCLVAGIPAAYVFARYEFPARKLLRTLLTIPFVLPTVVVASAFTALIGPGGLAERVAGVPLGLMRTLPAVLMAHVFYNVAIVVRIVGGLWSNLDPRLREAAHVLGAGTVRSFFTVTARLLLPAVLAAGVLVFGYCFTSFGVVLILGGPRIATLETEIYRQAVYLFDLPAAAFLSVIQLVFTGLLLLGYTRLQAAMSLTLRLAPSSLTARKPRGAGQWSLVLLFGVGVAVALIVPLLVLAAGSFGAPGRFDLDSWFALFQNTSGSLFWTSPFTAVGNSLLFSACAVLLSLLVGIPAALVLSRPRRERRALPFDLLELLFLLPLGASAVTLGFGFIISLDRPPIDLRASLLLVPIAHALVALPLVTRSVAAPLASLDPRLREAAAVLGAGPARVRWEIDLPILRRALLGAAAFAFTVSLGEFAATALLARPEFTTLPLAVFRFLQRPGELNRGQAFAMSTLLMAACAAGIAAIERARSRGTEAF